MIHSPLGPRRIQHINQPFDGHRQKLKEFVDNVTRAFELLNPNKHDLLLRSVKTKITRDAGGKFLVRDHTYIDVA